MSGKTISKPEVSPLGSPADRSPISSVFKVKRKFNPTFSHYSGNRKQSFSRASSIHKGKKYEMNREFPEQDLIKKALLGLFLEWLAIGALLSLLSIATFCYQLSPCHSQIRRTCWESSASRFSNQQISKVFFSRFTRLFFGILILSLSAIYVIKNFLIERANEIGIEINGIISSTTIFYLCIYTIVFLLINKQVIEKSISSLLD